MELTSNDTADVKEEKLSEIYDDIETVGADIFIQKDNGEYFRESPRKKYCKRHRA